MNSDSQTLFRLLLLWSILFVTNLSCLLIMLIYDVKVTIMVKLPMFLFHVLVMGYIFYLLYYLLKKK